MRVGAVETPVPDSGTAKMRSLHPGYDARLRSGPCAASKKYQRAGWVLALLFIVLFVEPNAIDHQLSRVFFLNINHGHRRAAGSAANSITNLDIVVIRHRFLQCPPMGEGVLPAGCPMYSVPSHGERRNDRQSTPAQD